MQTFSIRAYRAGDREIVRQICWATAFMGSGVEFMYRDRESWVDIFTSYYTDAEPESCWLATASDGRVVGYLLGCSDTRRAQSEARIALRHVIRRFLWARSGTAGFWWRALFDMLRNPFAGRPAVDLERFPAHMHCNLLPEARAAGVANDLFHAWHAALEARGVRGIHGEHLASNGRVHKMLLKLGYHPLGQAYLVPGFRTPENTRMYGQLVTLDIAEYRARVVAEQAAISDETPSMMPVRAAS